MLSVQQMSALTTNSLSQSSFFDATTSSSYLFSENVTLYRSDDAYGPITSNVSRVNRVYECGTFQFIWNTVIIGLLCVFGFLGNTLSFAVLSRDRSNRVACLLLQALAVADNSVLVVSFMVLSIISGMRGFGGIALYHYLPFIIKWIQPLGYMTQTAAVWCTVLLAVNRYIALCLPFKACRWATVRIVRLQLVAVFIAVLVLNVPRFFQYEVVVVQDEITNNTRYDYVHTAIGEQTIFGKVYTNALYTIVVLVLPLLLLLVLNTRIIREIRHLNARHAAITYSTGMRVRSGSGMSGGSNVGINCGSGGAGGGGADRDENMTKVMVVIVFAFLLCHTPDRILQIVKDLVGPQLVACGHSLYYVFNLCNFLVIFNSSCNFIIYYVMRRRFRRILLEKICGLRAHIRHSLHSFRMSTDSGLLTPPINANGGEYPHTMETLLHRRDTATSPDADLSQHRENGKEEERSRFY